MLCSVCSRNESTFITLEWRTSAPTDVAMPTSVVDTMRLLVIMMCVSEWTLEVRSTHSDWLTGCQSAIPLACRSTSVRVTVSGVASQVHFLSNLCSRVAQSKFDQKVTCGSLALISVMFIEYRFDTNRNNLSRFVSPHLKRRKAFLKLVRRSHLHLHLLPHPSQSRLYQRVCCCFFYIVGHPVVAF